MKRYFLFILALIWLAPHAAAAHSILQSAEPSADSTVKVSPLQIAMTFDTRIEKLSTFKLFNAAGEQVETGKVEVTGDTMTGKVPATLPNGIYTVKWTIIGADSHAVEGNYTFTVEAAQTSAPEQLETPTDENLHASPTPASTPKASSEPVNTSTNDDSGTAPFVIVGVIVIAAITLIAFVAARRKS